MSISFEESQQSQKIMDQLKERKMFPYFSEEDIQNTIQSLLPQNPYCVDLHDEEEYKHLMNQVMSGKTEDQDLKIKI